ncbi:hypothetical protein GCM10027217_25750 [Pseudomaricurvus hydrocarbonicus]
MTRGIDDNPLLQSYGSIHHGTDDTGTGHDTGRRRRHLHLYRRQNIHIATGLQRYILAQSDATRYVTPPDFEAKAAEHIGYRVVRQERQHIGFADRSVVGRRRVSRFQFLLGKTEGIAGTGLHHIAIGVHQHQWHIGQSQIIFHHLHDEVRGVVCTQVNSFR